MMAVKWCPPPKSINDTENMLISDSRYMRVAGSPLFYYSGEYYILDYVVRESNTPDGEVVNSFSAYGLKVASSGIDYEKIVEDTDARSILRAVFNAFKAGYYVSDV